MLCYICCSDIFIVNSTFFSYLKSNTFITFSLYLQDQSNTLPLVYIHEIKQVYNLWSISPRSSKYITSGLYPQDHTGLLPLVYIPKIKQVYNIWLKFGCKQRPQSLTNQAIKLFKWLWHGQPCVEPLEFVTYELYGII